MLLRVRQAICEQEGKEGEKAKDTEDQARHIRFRFHVRFTYSFPFPLLLISLSFEFNIPDLPKAPLLKKSIGRLIF